MKINFMSKDFQQDIIQALKLAHISYTQMQIEQWAEYFNLLLKWNKTYNLTAIDEPKAMISRHLIDSLSIADFIREPERIIDVGTGAGLPGLLLAIYFPHKQFTLLDSILKKTQFLIYVKNTLALSNVEIICQRAEEYQPPQPYDAVITRAFSEISEMLVKTQHLCAENGQFLAMKGKYPTEELKNIPTEFEILAVTPLSMVGLEAERHLVSVGKRG